jgi:uncharacterized protein
MKKTIISKKRIALILAISYISAGILLMIFQRSFIYFPQEANNPGLKEMVLKDKKEKIKILVSNEGCEDAILYFGGNAEAVYVYYDNFAHNFKNRTVYLVNYRGYGGSSGTPSEAALYEDALLAYDTLKSKHKNIAVIGRSLGSGVATYVAAKRDVKKLILVTPFDSVEAVAQAQFPIFPIAWMLLDPYDSIGRAKEIKAQTLLLIAGDDTLIPNENSMRLYNAFLPSQVHKQRFQGFGHNDIQSASRYYLAMKEFLGK